MKKIKIKKEANKNLMMSVTEIAKQVIIIRENIPNEISLLKPILEMTKNLSQFCQAMRDSTELEKEQP